MNITFTGQKKTEWNTDVENKSKRERMPKAISRSGQGRSRNKNLNHAEQSVKLFSQMSMRPSSMQSRESVSVYVVRWRCE